MSLTICPRFEQRKCDRNPRPLNPVVGAAMMILPL